MGSRTEWTRPPNVPFDQVGPSVPGRYVRCRSSVLVQSDQYAVNSSLKERLSANSPLGALERMRSRAEFRLYEAGAEFSGHARVSGSLNQVSELCEVQAELMRREGCPIFEHGVDEFRYAQRLVLTSDLTLFESAHWGAEGSGPFGAHGLSSCAARGRIPD